MIFIFEGAGHLDLIFFASFFKSKTAQMTSLLAGLKFRIFKNLMKQLFGNLSKNTKKNVQ